MNYFDEGRKYYDIYTFSLPCYYLLLANFKHVPKYHLFQILFCGNYFGHYNAKLTDKSNQSIKTNFR